MRPGGFGRVDNEVAAVERRGERPLDAKIEPVLRRELDGVADAGEGDKTAQFVKAVSAPAQNL